MYTLPVCRTLDWDTSFFGLRIARVMEHRLTVDRLAAIEAWCAEQGVECLYFLADADDDPTVALAELAGFHLVDVRITYERLLEEELDPVVTDPRLRIRPVEPRDLDHLKALARINHTDTRFFTDPRFSKERTAELYATWIEKSLNGYADATFVAEAVGEARGYITCHLEREHSAGSIGLTGVDADWRGHGIGRALVHASLHWFARQGLTKVSVVTQGRNIGAQRLYQRSGFVSASVQLWYHKWFTNR